MPEPELRPVRIGPARGDPEALVHVSAEVRELRLADVSAILEWAVSTGVGIPLPGEGATVSRWELLATVAAQDLTVARVLEPHLDALAILAEAGEHTDLASSWGVWAAEGSGARLTAHEDGTNGWVLDGVKPWCSLAGSVSHALVTAWVDDDCRRLFAVELAHRGVRLEDDVWEPAGLARVVTTPVTMTAVPAGPVGPPGWYLDRDGFWWGGIGVAAVWYGGAVGLARRLAAEVASREPDQLALMHLGEVDARLAAARAVLDEAGVRIDGGSATGHDAKLLAAQVRHVVAGAVEDVAQHVTHALGPGPLSREPEHVARVADLALYLRQHHAERDAVELGRLLLEDRGGAPPW